VPSFVFTVLFVQCSADRRKWLIFGNVGCNVFLPPAVFVLDSEERSHDKKNKQHWISDWYLSALITMTCNLLIIFGPSCDKQNLWNNLKSFINCSKNYKFHFFPSHSIIETNQYCFENEVSKIKNSETMWVALTTVAAIGVVFLNLLERSAH